MWSRGAANWWLNVDMQMYRESVALFRTQIIWAGLLGLWHLTAGWNTDPRSATLWKLSSVIVLLDTLEPLTSRRLSNHKQWYKKTTKQTDKRKGWKTTLAPLIVTETRAVNYTAVYPLYEVKRCQTQLRDFVKPNRCWLFTPLPFWINISAV